MLKRFFCSTKKQLKNIRNCVWPLHILVPWLMLSEPGTKKVCFNESEMAFLLFFMCQSWWFSNRMGVGIKTALVTLIHSDLRAGWAQTTKFGCLFRRDYKLISNSPIFKDQVVNKLYLEMFSFKKLFLLGWNVFLYHNSKLKSDRCCRREFNIAI